MSEFRKHFTYKLLTNIVRVPISLLLQSLFPRMLGPAAYGNFNFLTDIANKFIDFIDSGSSTAFYVKFSQNQRDRKLLRFYCFLLLLLISVYLLATGILVLTGFAKLMWVGQENFAIILSAVYGVGFLMARVGQYVLDANRLTVYSEKMIMSQLILSCLVFAVIYFLHIQVDLLLFFVIQVLLYVVLFFGNVLILRHFKMPFFPREALTLSEIQAFKKYFINYSAPLYLYTFLSFITGLADRWMLQMFGGSIQQGYFGISFKIAGVVLLVTTAMMPLLMRDFSVLFGNSERQLVGERFSKNARLLYSVVTIFAVCIFFNADFVINIIGGSQFKEAINVLLIMAFYPVHQTLGQINGTVFYSSNRIRQYTNLGMLSMPVSFLISFFLIAPKEYYGLDLGAVGLATGWVMIQLLYVNVMLYVNSKYLQTSYWKILEHQVTGFLVFGGIGKGIELVTTRFFHIPLGGLSGFIVFSSVFLCCVLCLLIFFPRLFALKNKDELFDMLKFKNRKQV